MAEVENVKVAVRVRPFNKREKDRKATMVIKMNGQTTTLNNLEDKTNKSYTFDYSYWSFDGFKEKSNGYLEPDTSHPNGKIYCDQKKIYNDLGKGILANAWKGFNACLFAYGQTGSGKSWSIIGYDVNKGIVPMLCEELFVGIKANTEPKQFEVYFSMLEIYNEVVRDLLNNKNSQKKQGLKVRQHPKKGFYADGLTKCMVSSQEEIFRKMDEGTVQRTVRATNMNATSSRAHTIVGITLIQKFKNERGEETAKSAVINLVDLAGSERVDSTGATGAALKEGAGINLSLSSLGKVIHALVLGSSNIPYRDSVLTKLLKNALGGNSKTVMVAALSPADINHDETYSTLIFADRAKQIKTKATVNESPTDKLIRELRMQNEVLMKQLKGQKIDRDFIDEDGDGIDDRDAAALRARWEEELKARLKQNDMDMMNMKNTYEERLINSQTQNAQDNNLVKNEKDKQTKLHIANLNPDPQLDKKIVHILDSATITVGKDEKSNITVVGPSIQSHHGTFTINKSKASLKPVNDDCRILVNGNPIKSDTKLSHNDRLVLGSTQLWVFQNPQDKSNKKMPPITYEYAQEEIAAQSGFDMKNLHPDADVGVIQQELMEVLPAVEEANAISAEMDRKVKFEIELLSPKIIGQAGQTKVQIKMINLENGTEFHFPKEKFLDRIFKMREMYNNMEDEEEYILPESEDPFHESLDTEVFIGTVHVLLQPIAHRTELKDKLQISSMKGIELGYLNVELVPCNSAGKEFKEEDDQFVDVPDDLIGQDFHFIVKIQNASGFPKKYKDIYCSYTIYLDKQEVKTETISAETSNPDFKHKKRFSFKKVTKQFIDYLCKDSLVIQVRGKQQVRGSAVVNGLSTKDMLKKDKNVFSKSAHLLNNGFQMNGRVVDPQKQSIIVELLLMKKTQAKLQQKIDNVEKLIEQAQQGSKLRISTILLREVMNVSSSEQADALIRKKLSDESDSGSDGANPKSAICTII